MFNFLKIITKNTLNRVGVDIIRLSNSSKDNLLGLGSFPISSVLDVGANEGQFARTVSKIFPHATIYSFEPLPEAFQKLTKWAEGMDGKVKVFNVALGDGEGETTFYYHVEHSPSSSFLKSTELCKNHYPDTAHQTSVQVKVSTLDKVVTQLPSHLNQEILIKLDVQGYEAHVIKGGMKIFSDAKACIIEVNLDRLYDDQATFKEIFNLLSDLGYCYAGNWNQAYADDGHVLYCDAVFIKHP